MHKGICLRRGQGRREVVEEANIDRCEDGERKKREKRRKLKFARIQPQALGRWFTDVHIISSNFCYFKISAIPCGFSFFFSTLCICVNKYDGQELLLSSNVQQMQKKKTLSAWVPFSSYSLFGARRMCFPLILSYFTLMMTTNTLFLFHSLLFLPLFLFNVSFNLTRQRPLRSSSPRLLFSDLFLSFSFFLSVWLIYMIMLQHRCYG